MRKKALMGLLAGVMIAGAVTGCGSKNDEKSNEDATKTTQATQTKQAEQDEQATAVKEDKATKEGEEKATETVEPTKEPKVTDSKGNEITKNPTATTPPLEIYKAYTDKGAKVYENEEGEIQADMPDGTSEILWSPYYGSGAETEKELTPYEEYKDAPKIEKGEQIMGVVDEKGKVKEYVGSDYKEFAAAYDTEFNYKYYSFGGPDNAEEYVIKLNEYFENKRTAEEIQEIVEQAKADGTVDAFRFMDVLNAVFTEDGQYAGFYVNVGTTSDGKDEADAWYTYLKKVDGKWLVTDERPEAIVKGLNDPNEVQ